MVSHHNTVSLQMVSPQNYVTLGGRPPPPPPPSDATEFPPLIDKMIIRSSQILENRVKIGS